MKKLSAKKDVNCMNCLACRDACMEVCSKASGQLGACIQIVEKNGTVKPAVCVQCGLCAKACESGAIKQNPNGVYMVNKKLCTGCGKCVEACPFDVMVKIEDNPVAFKCIACGSCTKVCPAGLLEIVES